MPVPRNTWDRLDISFLAKAVALWRQGEDGIFGVWIGWPGAGLKKYSPAPFAAREVYNNPQLALSPDGKRILLAVNRGGEGEEVWLLPYPAGTSPPKRILADVQSYSGTPSFAWQPDNRHIILAAQTDRVSSQLLVADTVTGEHHVLVVGTTSHDSPALSPDGRALVFAETQLNFDVVSVDLNTARVQPLIATERNEMQPSWAARQAALVYITDRNGDSEIWLHRPDDPERPVVTARAFQNRTAFFMDPTISPDGSRVIYTRAEVNSANVRLWISAVAGGAPVQFTNDVATEFPGSWSPDGNWFVYVAWRNGTANLMKVKTTGQATPVLLKAGSINDVPSWSPNGRWITNGHDVISADGQSTRPLSDHRSAHYAFSADNRLLYGLREDGDRELLFSVTIDTDAENIIGDAGKDFRPGSPQNPAMRFSLAPDGKSLVYGTGRFKQNLWLLEGFSPPSGLLARLHLR